MVVKVYDGHLQAEKSPDFSVEAFMFVLLYFPGRPMDRHGVGIVRWTIPAVIRYVYIKKKTTTFVVVFCVRVTYFPRQSPAKYRQRT